MADKADGGAFRRQTSGVCVTVEANGHGFSIAASGTTDIGSPRTPVNQDTYFVLDLGNGTIVLGVFDGHGKECGHLAAEASKLFFMEQCSIPSTLERLQSTPEKELRRLFGACHEHIYATFKTYFEAQGALMKEEQVNGDVKFLLRRKGRMQPYLCVHGGTTATIVLILNGTRVITANVGDSTALLAGTSVDSMQILSEAHQAPQYCSHLNTSESNNSTIPFVLLSGDHSPESLSEYERMQVSHDGKMQFLYDSSNKCIMRTPIFDQPASEDGGKYYKNVRNEWASMVAAPSDAQFADCLAFTRSIGDFHLHSYGLSWQPDIVEISLDSIWNEGTKDVALALATDGVWDVWQYDEFAEFIMSSGKEEPSGIDAKARARHLMQENLRRAQELFGDQADNMTAVLCYLSKTTQ
ncbi:hypothetical protein THRCLA_11598 [Thraustotheca clavata]|uniref:PPM-type phosphatase domain-containing protein n=1 Tax=Thraustotheca clavata TaxID=74557 RepID=A0A1V9Y789_9STRA|nr:hypothetical protein THRCLA_11598 [Thraustotheca clavata]